VKERFEWRNNGGIGDLVLKRIINGESVARYECMMAMEKAGRWRYGDRWRWLGNEFQIVAVMSLLAILESRRCEDEDGLMVVVKKGCEKYSEWRERRKERRGEGVVKEEDRVGLSKDVVDKGRDDDRDEDVERCKELSDCLWK